MLPGEYQGHPGKVQGHPLRGHRDLKAGALMNVPENTIIGRIVKEFNNIIIYYC